MDGAARTARNSSVRAEGRATLAAAPIMRAMENVLTKAADAVGIRAGAAADDPAAAVEAAEAA